MLGKNLIQAAAGNAAGEGLDVKDVFSTWLYTGNGSTQTITNGIDLAGEGGMVWIKSRSNGELHTVYDTVRGAGRNLSTAQTTQEQIAPSPYELYSFNSDGFSVGQTYYRVTNTLNQTFASWTFRKAPGFFDVVTWTGNKVARTIAHNLGSVPGCIIVKCTSVSQPWTVYHKSTGNGGVLTLNSTAAAFSTGTYWNSTSPTSTHFTVGTANEVNDFNETYVAYLFADDAGGFGDSGDDSVIKCGNCTAGTEENLGWEPQWVLVKKATATGDWRIYDNMRMQNLADYANKTLLVANASTAESTDGQMQFTATGFKYEADSIYIAIRRGPMKTPTDATSIFNTYQTSTSRLIGDKYDSNLYPPDLYIWFKQSAGGGAWWQDRLRGWKSFASSSTGAEEATTYIKQSGKQDELEYIGNWDNATGYANWYFRRAPGFFDVVAYTGTGSSLQKVDHGLGVKPQFYIIKCRSNATTDWYVWVQTSTSPSPNGTWTLVKLASGAATYSGLTGIGTTSTYFETYWDGGENSASGRTYIAYLFATCPGVSKCGGYTGTGTTLNVDCGFTNGARFVLIKRTDSTGDWYVWDTARGIVSGNDPSLLLNSSAAEVTNTDYIDPLSSGFQISSTAPAAINASGGSFIFLAIA